MAKEWEIEGLSPDDEFREAARKIILTKSAELWHYAPGTIAGEDIEELHSMRVSSRRLRAAVDVCAPCFPRKSYARWQKRVSGLTEELGAVRDADVMLDFLRRERKQASQAERAGLDDLIEQVTAQAARRFARRCSPSWPSWSAPASAGASRRSSRAKNERVLSAEC